MRFETPELQALKEAGSILTTEMELFMNLCPAEIFAITGSDGKTTTTTLTAEILKQAGYKVWIGGNIGTPLLDRVGEIEPDDKVVLELSSFQLLGMSTPADVAIVTNITPNHLDFHRITMSISRQRLISSGIRAQQERLSSMQDAILLMR